MRGQFWQWMASLGLLESEMGGVVGSGGGGRTGQRGL